MNLFSAITSWLGAYNALSSTQMGQDIINKGKQAIAPITQPIQKAFTPAIQTAQKTIAPITNTIWSVAKPVIKSIDFNNRTNAYYTPFKSEIEKIGLTYDDLAELPEEEKQQVVSQLKQIGVQIPWYAEQEQEKQAGDWYNNKSYFWDQRKDEGIIEQWLKWIVRTPLTYAQNAIMWPENIAQGSMNLLEKTLWEGALNPLLNVVWSSIKWDKYKPLPTWYNDVPSTNQYTENVASNIIGAGKEALTTWKTYSQANEELKQQQYKAGKDQWIGGSLANIAGGGVSTAFNIIAPWASALFAWASEMPWTQYVTQWLGALTQAPIDYVVNKAGWTQETAEQIGTVANLALPLGRNKIAGMKPTSKPWKIIQKTAVSTADAIINPLWVVKKVLPTKQWIKNMWNNTAEALLLKQWKLDKKTRDTIKSQWEDSGAKFILERDLSKWNIEETADNVGAYKYSKMQEKLDAVDTFWDTTVPDVAINMAKKMQERISRTIEDSYGKMTPDQTVEILNQNHPEYAKMYQFLSEVQGSNKTSFASLEKIKELYDATNPENLKWDIQNKPENQIAHDLVAQKRSKLQTMLEEEWVKRWININEINKEIQKATTVQRGLEKASSRRENLNMFWLWDSQTAIVSAILGGAPWAIWALLFKKWLENEWVRGTIARKLFTKTPKNDIPMNNSSNSTPGKSRVGRIMNRDSGVATPEVEKKTVPKPTASKGIVAKKSVVPKKVAPIIEKTVEKPTNSKIIWLTDETANAYKWQTGWWIKNVEPWKQVKYNQWDSYEPVRMALTQKDADISRFWALSKKQMKSSVTENEKREMAWIKNRLKMTNAELETRAQELRDIAKNARSKTETVLVDLRNEPRTQPVNLTKAKGGFIRNPFAKPEPKLAPEGKAMSIPKTSLIEEARRYKSAEELGIKTEKWGHLLDQLKSLNIDSAKIKSSLFGNEISFDKRDLLKQTTGKLRSNYWMEKIRNGERPVVLVDSMDGKLSVIDGNHKVSAYKALGIDNIPTIYTNNAKSQILDIYNQPKWIIPKTLIEEASKPINWVNFARLKWLIEDVKSNNWWQKWILWDFLEWKEMKKIYWDALNTPIYIFDEMHPIFKTAENINKEWTPRAMTAFIEWWKLSNKWTPIIAIRWKISVDWLIKTLTEEWMHALQKLKWRKRIWSATAKNFSEYESNANEINANKGSSYAMKIINRK